MPGFDTLKPPSASSGGSIEEALNAVKEAQRLQNKANEALSLLALAAVLERDGQFQESLLRAIEALDACQELQEKKGRASALQSLSRTHLLRGAPAEALQVAAEALELSKALGDGTWEVSAARLLVAAAAAHVGPSGTTAAVFAAEADLAKGAEALRARCSAGLTAKSFEDAARCRRNRFLGRAEAKSFTARGDHEGALRQVADAPSLAQGLQETPYVVRLGLTAEVIASLTEAVEILSREKDGRQKALAALAKVNLVFFKGAASEEVLTSCKTAMELCKAAGDKVLEAAAQHTMESLEAKSLSLASTSLSAAREKEEKLSEAEALLYLAQAHLAQGNSLPEVLEAVQQALILFRDLGFPSCEALVQSMLATSYSMLGEASEASKASKESRDLALEDRGAEAAALEASIFAALVASKAEEALQHGRDLVKVSRYFNDKLAESFALGQLARLHLANDDPGQAVRAAEDAVELAAASKLAQASVTGQAAALRVLAKVHGCRGKPAAALRAAEQLLALPGRAADTLAKGSKGEAIALLVASEANAASHAALATARDAEALFVQLKDQQGQGAAKLALASTLLMQPQRELDGALAAAREASSCFRSRGDSFAEAVALCATANIHLLREETSEAEKVGKEALRLFKEDRASRGAKGTSPGEARAKQLLMQSQLKSQQPSAARLFFDEFSVAHLELNELASQESLEAAIATLHNMQRVRKNVKAVVMHLDGTPAPVTMHSYALTSGTFMVGLRSISVPLILACCGKIAGPSWSLALACDYRLADCDTQFLLPVIAPPECLGDLVGQAVAAQLCISNGCMPAQAVQEMGIFQQVRPGKDDTSRAASELAKRIAAFPSVACKQTIGLLSVPALRYTAVGAQRLPDRDLMA